MTISTDRFDRESIWLNKGSEALQLELWWEGDWDLTDEEQENFFVYEHVPTGKYYRLDVIRYDSGMGFEYEFPTEFYEVKAREMVVTSTLWEKV